jgi:predicted RecB family nuclease
MQPAITSEVVVAYAQCPRKAYLLLFSPDRGEPHEYVRMLEQQRCEHQARYLDLLQHNQADVHPYTGENLRRGRAVLIHARLQADGCEADCGVLTRVENPSTGGPHRYEPTTFVGTYSITTEQQLALSFVAYVLERLQHEPPRAGRIMGMDGTAHTVKLDNRSTVLLPLLEPLRAWTTTGSPEPPPIILNKHCPLCPFRRMCQPQAEHADNLSLLDHMTPKMMTRYHQKGIFTVHQLSYVFKPRRRRKGVKRQPVHFNVELQALAIRTGKIYIHALPELTRHPTELFLDFEGIPDQSFHYLIGLLICEGGRQTYHALWADTMHDEERIWNELLAHIQRYPEAPISHYGSYEPKVIAQLANRYGTPRDGFMKRLVNINAYIYGKIYFPVRSNTLKALGAFVGASWTEPEASGLQSLVWRYHWEETRSRKYQEMLLTYNEEDCKALKQLSDALSRIKDSADTLSEVDFAHQPKQHATEVGEQIHRQFGAILQFAHADYDKKKISFSQSKAVASEKHRQPREHGPKRGYYGHRKIKLKATKIIEVPQDKFCPKHKNEPLLPTESMSKRLIIDLVLTKNGLRKTITEYVGVQGYCAKCYHQYAPQALNEYNRNQLYGHGFRAWHVYQRVALRMPYESMVEMMEEQFHEKTPGTSIPNFIRDFAGYYAKTEESITQRLLESSCIHVDETPINIRGVSHYVWVFTDGKYVVFKFSETREATIAHEFLAHYQGVLISDFYPGYDSVRCQQQKCWVHLIRDLNDDLWAAPFDIEFERFILKVRNLIVPIMEAIQKYGLKKRHLHHFQKHVDLFYEEIILNQHYHSELALKYQNRFIRYHENLFTFLEHAGIPWENNTAERALRHLTVQEKISGSFHKSLMPDYLRLLAMRQMCRFQGKSFFKFLFSGETDLEKFASHKRNR